MRLLKNKTTPEGREFWEHVEKVAAEVRAREEEHTDHEADVDDSTEKLPKHEGYNGRMPTYF